MALQQVCHADLHLLGAMKSKILDDLCIVKGV